MPGSRCDSCSPPGPCLCKSHLILRVLFASAPSDFLLCSRQIRLTIPAPTGGHCRVKIGVRVCHRQSVPPPCVVSHGVVFFSDLMTLPSRLVAPGLMGKIASAVQSAEAAVTKLLPRMKSSTFRAPGSYWISNYAKSVCLWPVGEPGSAGKSPRLASPAYWHLLVGN